MITGQIAIDLAVWSGTAYGTDHDPESWSDFSGCCILFRNLPLSVMQVADEAAADAGLTRSEDVFVSAPVPVELPFRAPVPLPIDFPTDGLRDDAGFTI